LLDWGAAVLHCGPRDRYIGWDRVTRERNLTRVVGNRRFLILPWVRVPHLASRILGANLRRLNCDWQLAYAHSLLLAETFVDTGRFRGTCYRAANWRYLGQTLGFARHTTDARRRSTCTRWLDTPWSSCGRQRVHEPLYGEGAGELPLALP